MATKFLNLDEIAPSVEKTVTINGVQHDMAPVSVLALIEDVKRQNALTERFGDKPVPAIDLIDAVIGMITSAFPTVTREDVVSLTVPQMNALREFIVEQNEPTAEEAKEIEAAAGNV